MRKRIMAALGLVLILLFQSGSTILAQPDHEDRTTIRVGYYLFDGYQERNANGRYSGYAYDYYKEIAQFADWDYDFVIEDFGTCMEMLQNGEIDVISGVEKSDSAGRQNLEYSQYPIGETQCELYAIANRAEYSYDDYASFDGMTVAVMKGNNQTEALVTLFEDHDLHYTLHEYDSQEEMEQALVSGEVDALYNSTIGSDVEYKVLSRFLEIPIYIATLKDSPVMTKINDALKTIHLVNPYFENNLGKKYRSNSGSIRPEFTKEELDYIANAPAIRIAGNQNGAPIEMYDGSTGSYTGIAADVFDLLAQITGLEFTYTPRSSYPEARQSLEDKTIDILTAMPYDYNWANRNNTYLTYPYINSSIVMVARNNSDLETGIIALPREDYLESLLEDELVGREITYFSNAQECIDAVKNKKADVTYTNHYVANYYLADIQYRNLYTVQLNGVSEDFSIAVSKDMDPVLLRILDKGLLCISDDEIDNIILNNTLRQPAYSLENLIYAQPYLVINIVAGVFVALILLIVSIFVLRSKRDRAVKKILERDALTGLLNRGTALKEIGEAMEEDAKIEGRYCVLITIDLDNFKKVNDTYGHMEGDLLLKKVADTLISEVRSSDIVARMGGDEFVIYLRAMTNPMTIEQKAGHICMQIRLLSDYKKEWEGISASIGVAATKQEEINWDELYHTSDVAMYQAKEDGKNKYHIIET